jgi:hypothetical protein
MEWDDLETVKVFKEYVVKYYSAMNTTSLIGQVSNWSNYLRGVNNL